MKHPNRETLALHAGGDLGPFARWRAERHLGWCERCREELNGFERMRQILPDLAKIPEVPWNRLAAEMKANIRLGLAAGECVRSVGESSAPLGRSPLFSGARAVMAFASMLAVLAAGLVLECPSPVATQGIVVQPAGEGIQVRQGDQVLRLLHSGAQNVTYSVGAQGAVRARYVDPETGYVTIQNVYAE